MVVETFLIQFEISSDFFKKKCRVKIQVDISILETVPNQIQIRRFRAIVKVEIVLFETVAIQISTRIRIRVNIILHCMEEILVQGKRKTRRRENAILGNVWIFSKDGWT